MILKEYILKKINACIYSEELYNYLKRSVVVILQFLNKKLRIILFFIICLFLYHKTNEPKFLELALKVFLL